MRNFTSGVEALGGEIERFMLSYSMRRPDWSDFGRSNAKKNYELRTYVKNKKELPVLAIFLTYDDCLEIETLELFKTLGIYTVCYHVDMVGQWYRILRTGPHFNLVACAQKLNISLLRRYGINAEYIPMAACHADEVEVDHPEKVISFIGAPQAYRLWMLNRIKDFFPIRCYGMWFDEPDSALGFVPDDTLAEKPSNIVGKIARMMFNGRYVLPIATRTPYVLADKFRGNMRHPSISKESLKDYWSGSVPAGAMASFFARSLFNIGFTYFCGKPETDTEIRQCRLREFEGPLYSTSGPYLMQSFPELRDLYEADEEVVVWDTIGELKYKLVELSANEKLCREISIKGRQAVLTRHLWSHRLKEILMHMETGNSGKGAA